MKRLELEPNEARAMLRWLIDAGADEALAEAPIDRFAVAVEAIAAPATAFREASARGFASGENVNVERSVPRRQELPQKAPAAPIATPAREIAAKCQSLDQLREAVERLEGYALKVTAKSTVFADGAADAPVMLIGEAPGRDEDLEGLPFVGRSGQLLDRMLNSIGLDRRTNAYITNVIFWRPPGNRTPTPEEAAMCAPFLLRHIELKQPKVLVLLGGTPVKHILNIEEGITRTRGRWGRYVVNGAEIPVLPMFHPAYLLRQPNAKRQTWQDLLSLKQRLRELGVF
jgi:DNA polymerase